MLEILAFLWICQSKSQEFLQNLGPGNSDNLMDSSEGIVKNLMDLSQSIHKQLSERTWYFKEVQRSVRGSVKENARNSQHTHG